jgi:hypothetical protein
MPLFAVVERGMGLSWSWSYGSWIYNYLCNQCLSPLILQVWTPLRWGALDTTLCDKVCQWLATGRLISPGTPVSSTNKTDRQDINEILLKMGLNTINQAKPESVSIRLLWTHSFIIFIFLFQVLPVANQN